MKRITVAAAAVNQTPLAWRENSATIRRAVESARKLGASVVCLPELCVTGYGCEDAFHSQGVLDMALERAVELARFSKGLVVTLGLPLSVHGIVYNTVGIAVDGELRGFVAKQGLASDGIHYEPRWFKPWKRGDVSSIVVAGKAIPVGDLFFEIDGVRIGCEICEDAWIAERPGIFLARHGIDLILNPSASHFAFGKHEVRKRVVLEGSRACGVAYVYANLLGCEAGRVIYDGDSLICSHGELIASGSRFSYQDYTITVGVVDIDRSRLIRKKSGGFQPEYGDHDRLVSIAGFRLKPPAKRTASREPAWERSSNLKHEEFTRAVSLGLFDYLRKSRSEGFVVSLSGGVDSSAVSCLVALMAESAVRELGLATFKRKLSYIPWMKRIKAARQIVPSLLACVYQGTRNSSRVTRRAARSLAEEIGATFVDLNVDPLVREYTQLISRKIGVSLSWKAHDLALQNIQARVRSPSVWLLANIRRALLLATGNRSEASVGYATMDGDSSGGLSPLGGIDKAYLREWLRWLERESSPGARSFATLRLVNEQEPTAELRPLKERQTDEGDLMPYEVLDVIERYAIRDKRLPLEVFQLLSEDFGDRYTASKLVGWIEKFFTLWSRNQWKRERFAPSFHLDDESVDPKTWCRFPILSGGYIEELELLKKKVRRR